jgi:uncharacterized membrane-anchored protein
MSRAWKVELVVLSLASLLVAGRSRAASEPPVATPGEKAEAAPSATEPRPELGPKKIALGDELVLDLPENMGYFDRDAGRKLMEKMGNRVGDSFRGLVFKRDAGWLIELAYVGDGYVKDDDASDLKPADILSSIKEGTEQANEFRKEKGFRAVHVDGWTEAPRYDRAVHHLVWGIKGKYDDGASASVNFYTRVLGRRGYVALNLMDAPDSIEASKVDGLVVLRATTFKPGARYEDFDKSKDKVAEYGLAALVLGGAGVAAVKLVKVGLLAKFGGKLIALLFAAKKLVVLFFVGAGAWLKKTFGKRGANAPVETSSPAAASAPEPTTSARAVGAPEASPPPASGPHSGSPSGSPSGSIEGP